jgi:hypothetical protein
MSMQVSGPFFGAGVGGGAGGGGRRDNNGGRGGRGGITKPYRTENVPRCLYCHRRGHVMKDCRDAQRAVRELFRNTLAMKHDN